MNNSQATTQKSDEVRTITTTETLSATSTQTPLDIQTTLVPSTFELEEQEDELLLPVQIETQDTAQLTEKAQALFEKLDARYAMPVEKPIEQPSGIKARRERNARIAKGKEISPTGDEYTVAVKEAIDRRRLVTDMSMPDVDLEQYRARARAAHIDFRQLLTLSKKVKLNDKGEADPQELRKVKQKNRVFIDDFSSGEQERQRPHLDRITDEILEFNSIMEFVYLGRNLSFPQTCSSLPA